MSCPYLNKLSYLPPIDLDPFHATQASTLCRQPRNRILIPEGPWRDRNEKSQSCAAEADIKCVVDVLCDEASEEGEDAGECEEEGAESFDAGFSLEVLVVVVSCGCRMKKCILDVRSRLRRSHELVRVVGPLQMCWFVVNTRVVCRIRLHYCSHAPCSLELCRLSAGSAEALIWGTRTHSSRRYDR